jgi:hypothetical protein
MERSPVTAVLRVFDTGQDHVAAYYVDLLDQQHLVDVWPRAQVVELAHLFAREHGFDGHALSVIRLGSAARSSQG